MNVKELMTPNPESIPSTETVMHAAKRMKSLNIGVLPVFEDGKEAGMITDRDIITRVIAEGLNPAQISVGEVMTKQVFSCTENTDIGEAARIMETNKIRRLVVKSEAGEVTGVVSLGDIAVHATKEVSAEILKEVSEPSTPSR